MWLKLVPDECGGTMIWLNTILLSWHSVGKKNYVQGQFVMAC